MSWSKYFLIQLSLFLLVISVYAQETQSEHGTSVKIVLFPFREAVVASTVPAKVMLYKIKEGQPFRENEVIVTLDDRSYKQAYLKASAIAREIQAALIFAEANYKRAQDTFAKNAIGLQELEQSLLDKETSEAKLQYAKASLEQAAVDFESCSIRLPFNGRLTKKIAKENEYVGIGQPLLEVIDDSKLLAVTHLPSAKRTELKPGDELSFRVDETGTVRKGKIFEMSGRIDFESRTFEVKILVDNSKSDLTAGMSGFLIQGE